MPTYTVQASAKDANEVVSTGAVNYTNTGTETTSKIDGTHHAGFRFDNVNIERGTGIAKAVFRFPQLWNWSGVGHIDHTDVYGESQEFGGSNGNELVSTAFESDYTQFGVVSGRTLTNAHVKGSTLSANDTQFTTNGVDVTEIVQEMIDGRGWVSGLTLAIVFKGDGTAGNFIQPYMWDYSSGYFAAELEITLANSTGYTAPTIATDDNPGHTFNGSTDLIQSWANVNNALQDDGNYATASNGMGGWTSSGLKLTGFNFNIPSTSTINGITAKIHYGGDQIGDTEVRLIKGGSPTGTNMNELFAFNTAPIDYYLRGTNRDTWAVPLTPAEVNASDFGLYIKMFNTHNGGTAYVDSVQLNVYYDNEPLEVIGQASPGDGEDIGNHIDLQGSGEYIAEHAITIGSTPILLQKLRYRFSAVSAASNPKAGTPGFTYVGSPFQLAIYSTEANARAETSAIKSWTQTLKNSVFQDYDFDLGTSPHQIAANGTLYVIIKTTGADQSSGTSPQYMNADAMDVDATAVFYESVDKSTWTEQSGTSPIYELLEIATVKYQFDGDSSFSADGSVTTQGEADLSANSSFQATGAHEAVGQATWSGEADTAITGGGDWVGAANSLAGSSFNIVGAIEKVGSAEINAGAEVSIAGDAEYSSLQKKFMYKCYRPDGSLSKTWLDVVSDFELKEEINSAGSEVTVTLAREPDDFGEGKDVDYKNKVMIYAVDSDAPNGVLKFQGYISKYSVDWTQSTVDVTLLGFGAEMSQYVMEDASGNTTIAYNSMDPSDILKAIIDDYNAKGGTIAYDASSIDTTGTTVSYTFNTNTVLEGVDKCLELAPAGWYYYIDQATNTLHFHEKSTDADHTFALGLNIASLTIEKSMEDIVNTVYFSGGGDPPLYKKYIIQNSIDTYGVKGERVKDGRVTLVSTADILAGKHLRGDPEILVNVAVIDGNLNAFGYDIETVHMGQIIRISNAGTGPVSVYDLAQYDVSPYDYDLTNLSSISFQITSLDYSGDILAFSLSTTPPDITKRIEDINRNLVDLQNSNNPSAPTV